MPSGGKELYCALRKRLFDAGLGALERNGPGNGVYYGTLRCQLLPFCLLYFQLFNIKMSISIHDGLYRWWVYFLYV